MKELYINGRLIDLKESEPIPLNFSVNNLAELKDRQAYGSGSFKIPDTQNNRIACGFPSIGQLIQLEPYRLNLAKLVQNGIEIVPNGIATIKNSGAEIEVQVLSGLINFFDLLSDKSIRDLDLSEYDHVWYGALQTATSGYIYPIIDYGALPETGKLVNNANLRPATFRHTLIEKIVSEAGFTMSGEILSDERHLKSLLPFSLDKFLHGGTASENKTTAGKKLSDQPLSNDDRDGDIAFSDFATSNPYGYFDGTSYTPSTIQKIKVTVKFGIGIRDQYAGGSNPAIAIRIYKNISVIAENLYTADVEFTDINFFDQTMETEFNMYPGDTFKITWHSTPATDRIYGVIFSGATIDIVADNSEVIFGQTVQLAATLPDISQKDFFKDWLQNFGLIVIPNSYLKQIKLVNMGEIYANRYRALDWTDKFTRDRGVVSYSFENYGINNFGYYKDDEAVPDAVGEGKMIFDNLTLNNNVELFTSKFAGSISVYKLDGLLVTQIKKVTNSLPNPAIFDIKTQYRILMDRKINGNLTGFDVISAPYFEQSGLPGLGYQELFDNYYDEIKRMLYRPYIVEKPCLLKESDIANLDWTIPIYDRNESAYFYLNKISNFVEGELCKVSLIKLQ